MQEWVLTGCQPYSASPDDEDRFTLADRAGNVMRSNSAKKLVDSSRGAQISDTINEEVIRKQKTGRDFAHFRLPSAKERKHNLTSVCLLLLLLFLLILLGKPLLIEGTSRINPGSDHCYSDIGCFPLSEEFYHPVHRPFNIRPWHRSRINTRFELFTRMRPYGHMLVPWDRSNLQQSGFNPSLETKVIIPGWLDGINRTAWIKKIKEAFLWIWDPVNIIVVHWHNFTPYTIATANTRVVGAEMANLIQFLEHELDYSRAYYHLIGHSLGAHIAGYAGDRVPGMGRITALDPARPFFQHMPKSTRLDRADANFVDAIHSDFTPENAIFLLMSFGMTTPVGHLDFYPNGPPLLQPGCLRDTLTSVQLGIQKGLEVNSLPTALLEAARYMTACDHQRSHEWFVESVLNRGCLFVGVRCNTFEGLINGRCTCDDSPSACAIMGIHADQLYLQRNRKSGQPLHRDPYPLSHNILADLERRDRARKQRERSRHRDLLQPIMQMAANEAYSKASPSEESSRAWQLDQMRERAEQLRSAPSEWLERDLIESLAKLDEDSQFVEYLQTNMLLSEEPLDSFDRRQDSDESTTRMLTSSPRGSVRPGGHPLLSSSFERDIETWYEDTGRWYLKTHNRPNYCVNQYQLMVFLGPLESASHGDRLRADLVVSIIGTRGRLLNQRFVPRSSQLSSHSMQPFFIMLDGTFSLGRIIEVAIGWEPRRDLSPVQASLSFESSPFVAQLQEQTIPSLTAKQPLISETIRYDYSPAFVSLPGLYRRSGEIDDERINNHVDVPPPSYTGPLANQTRLSSQPNNTQSGTFSGTRIPHANERVILGEGDYLDLQTEPSSLDSLIGEALTPALNLKLNNLDTILQQGMDAQLLDIQLSGPQVTINQVMVSPIQAHYGINNEPVARRFCPPHFNYPLRRDRTVRLIQGDLMGNRNRCRPFRKRR